MKPPWCQPITIVLTGSSMIVGASSISHSSLLWTAVVAVPVAVWWTVFLVLYPAEWRQYAQQVNAQLDRDAL